MAKKVFKSLKKLQTNFETVQSLVVDLQNGSISVPHDHLFILCRIVNDVLLSFVDLISNYKKDTEKIEKEESEILKLREEVKNYKHTVSQLKDQIVALKILQLDSKPDISRENLEVSEPQNLESVSFEKEISDQTPQDPTSMRNQQTTSSEFPNHHDDSVVNSKLLNVFNVLKNVFKQRTLCGKTESKKETTIQIPKIDDDSNLMLVNEESVETVKSETTKKTKSKKNASIKVKKDDENIVAERKRKRAGCAINAFVITADSKNMAYLMQHDFIPVFCEFLLCPKFSLVRRKLSGIKATLKNSKNPKYEICQKITDCGALEKLKKLEENDCKEIQDAASAIINNHFIIDSKSRESCFRNAKIIRSSVEILNLPESTKETPLEMNQEDRETANEIIKQIGVSCQILKVFRIDDKNNVRPRSLMVELNGSAYRILSNAKNLKFSETFKNMETLLIRKPMSEAEIKEREELHKSLTLEIDELKRSNPKTHFFIYANTICYKDSKNSKPVPWHESQQSQAPRPTHTSSGQKYTFR